LGVTLSKSVIFTKSMRKLLLLPLLLLGLNGCPNSVSDPVSPGGSSGLAGTIYYNGQNIRTLNLGTGSLAVFGSGRGANVTPSGTVIAFLQAVGLVEYAADGQTYRTIVPIEEMGAEYDDMMSNPQLSPDGSMIAYDGLPRRYHVYVVNRQTGELMADFGNGEFECVRPQWLSNTELSVERAGQGGGIWRIDGETGDAARIDQLAEPKQHAVSKDKQQIATIVGYDVYVMNVDGTNARSLVSAKSKPGYPVFSPDGKWVAISIGCDIWFYPVAGGAGVNADGLYSQWNNNWCPELFQMDWK
jgi:hypothetical protein